MILHNCFTHTFYNWGVLLLTKTHLCGRYFHHSASQANSNTTTLFFHWPHKFLWSYWYWGDFST